MKHSQQNLRLIVLLAIFWAGLSQLGCVQRKMLINSFPEGASVSVDGQHVGYTPLAVDYLYYGTRDILVEKDGFKTVRVQKDFNAPWYQYPPLNFISDNFAMRQIQDTDSVEFQLQPKDVVDQKNLIDRAEMLRGQVLGGAVKPSGVGQEYQWKK